MKKIRPHPYGYSILNGSIIVVEQEAACVKKIFTEYLNGQPIPSIANHLNVHHIPYYQGTKWNKNAICRILDNSKYCGMGEYPPIIPDDIFASVKNKRKNSHIKTMSPEINLIRKKLFCDRCGQKMLRIKRPNRTDIMWQCKGCGAAVWISDELLVQAVKCKIDGAARTSACSDYDGRGNTISMKQNLLYAEISRKMNDSQIDVGDLTGLVKQYIEEKYLHTAISESFDELQELLTETNGRNTFNERRFLDNIAKIMILQNSQVRIRLASGQIIH